jgi:hypothetical protein
MRIKLLEGVPVAFASFSNPTVAVDIVTENRFTDLNLASNELLHGFGQKRFTKRCIALSAGLYGLLEVSG